MGKTESYLLYEQMQWKFDEVKRQTSVNPTFRL